MAIGEMAVSRRTDMVLCEEKRDEENMGEDAVGMQLMGVKPVGMQSM